jgi:hypothetical protein
LPDFSWNNIPKYTKRPQHIPYGHKIYIPNGGEIDQLAEKNYQHQKYPKNLPKLGFLV